MSGWWIAAIVVTYGVCLTIAVLVIILLYKGLMIQLLQGG